MTRVLVTGAGGPASVAVIRSLLGRSDAEVYSTDVDGWASGLYRDRELRAKRWLIPKALLALAIVAAFVMIREVFFV